MGGLGAGILSLPWTSAGASIVPAAAITAVVLAVNAWTNLILVEAAEKLQVFDIGAILRHLPGRLGLVTEVMANGLVWATQFMVLVGYFIIVADAFGPQMASLLGDTPLASRSALVTLSALAVLPICYMDMRRLAWTSTLAIVVTIYLCALVVYLCFMRPLGTNRVCAFGVGRGGVSMCSALMMAVIIQMNVLPMYENLERRSVARFRYVQIASFTCLTFLFVAFQTVAVFAFGKEVESNVLLGLPDIPASNAARCGMFVVVLGVYPINLTPMVAPVRNASRGGKAMANAATMCIVLGTMAVAYFVTDLGFMNVVNGAIQTWMFVGVAPGFVGIYLLDYNWFAMVVLIIVCSSMSLVGLALTSNYVEDLEQSCTWNLT